MPVNSRELFEDGCWLLNSAEDEARRRSAVSRLYYATYHHVLAHPRLAELGAEIAAIQDQARRERRNAPGKHTLLADRLCRSNQRVLRHAGQQLRLLFKRRVDADYLVGEAFSQQKAADALDIASELIEELLPLTAVQPAPALTP
ncbi:MAG: hypothetical protein H7Z12_08965 [Rhodospirillaceae bacterium]|nr:hypothetical protein [Rhodospirillales bacterium]